MKSPLLWAFAAWLAVGAIYWQTARPGHDWGGDFSVYLWQAQNLATGQPYSQSTFVPTPRSLNNHPAVYPPLTSALMAPFVSLFGMDYQQWKRFLLLPLWLSLPVWFCIGRRAGLTHAEAGCTLLLFALSILVQQTRDYIGSETTYLLISGLVLLLLLEGQAKKWDQRYPWILAPVVAMLFLLCYATRAAALALVVGFLLAEVIRAQVVHAKVIHEWRLPRFPVAVAVAFALGLIAYNRWVFNAGSQYGSQFGIVPMTYVLSLRYYLLSQASLWNGSPALPRYLFTIAIALLAAWVLFWRSVRPTVLEGYVVVSYGLLTVYSVSQNARYLFGVYPIILFYAALGLRQLSQHFRLPLWTPALAAVASLALLVPAWAKLETGPVIPGVTQPSFIAVCDYLRSNTPPQTGAILNWNPRLFALYTGRRSLLFADPPDLPQQARALPGPLHLVLFEQELDHRELDPYLAQHGNEWTLAYQNQDFRVFRRKELQP